MFRILCSLCAIAFFFTSCTSIVSTNFPGRAENTIPAGWQGRYILKLPSALSSMEIKDKDGQMTRQYVTIQQDKIIWDHSPEVSIYTLNDSLIISTVDEEKYISIKNPEGYYVVMQVKQRGDNLRLFPTYATKELDETDLKPYFDKVKKVGNTEESKSTYGVKIVDKKLGDYFKSSLVEKEPVELLRQ
jgi:hypothetical protein